VPDSVKPWVDRLLSGKLDKTFHPSDALAEWSIDIEPYKNSQFHFCTETAYYSGSNNHWQYLTEKSIKCLVSGSPFIVIGQRDCHKRLVELGFKLPYFSSIAEFDHLPDGQRLNQIFKFIDFLNENFDPDYLQEYAEINYNYKDFYEVVEARNAETAKQVLNIIESLTLRA
jgi:hypothetical protein